MYFRYYRLQKTLPNKCLKSPVSEDSLTSNMLSRTKHCWNLNDITFRRLLISMKTIKSGKSLLVMCKVLKLFGKAFTGHDEYSFLNRDNLTQPNEMQLSQKQKDFYQIFSWFSEFYIKFCTFSEKEDSHSWWISEITD